MVKLLSVPSFEYLQISPPQRPLPPSTVKPNECAHLFLDVLVLFGPVLVGPQLTHDPLGPLGIILKIGVEALVGKVLDLVAAGLHVQIAAQEGKAIL